MCWDRFLMSQRIFILYRFLLDTTGIDLILEIKWMGKIPYEELKNLDISCVAMTSTFW